MTQGKFNFKVTWQPFLLRPEMPPEGIPKPPDPSGPTGRLANIGRQVGIEFAYKADRYPNTVMGHCALEYALDKDQSGKTQNELQEKLFKAYFTDGTFLSADVVSTLAAECGLQYDEVKKFIENPENQQKVRAKASKNSADGVSGVPFFVINGQGMISGAQEPETLVKAFETANNKFPLTPAPSM